MNDEIEGHRLAVDLAAAEGDQQGFTAAISAFTQAAMRQDDWQATMDRADEDPTEHYFEQWYAALCPQDEAAWLAHNRYHIDRGTLPTGHAHWMNWVPPRILRRAGQLAHMPRLIRAPQVLDDMRYAPGTLPKHIWRPEWMKQ